MKQPRNEKHAAAGKYGNGAHLSATTLVEYRGISLSTVEKEICKYLWGNIDTNFETIFTAEEDRFNSLDNPVEFRLYVKNKTLDFDEVYSLSISNRELGDRYSSRQDHIKHLERELCHQFSDRFRESGEKFKRIVYHRTAVLHVDSKDKLISQLCRRHVREQMDNRNMDVLQRPFNGFA